MQNIITYMYRYLEKFIGTYRVLAHYDIELNDFPRDETGAIDKSFDDLYIPCRKGLITHTYDDYDRLVLCLWDKRPSAVKNIYNEIKEKYPKIEIDMEISGNDGFIYFHAKDIKKIATVVKPKTSGSKIKWSDNRNLPKVSYEIPEEDLKEFTEITEKLDRTQKMHFAKSCNSAFLESISNSRFDAKAEMKKSRLSAKEYIHSIGMWDKYIKFAKKKVKEV